MKSAWLDEDSWCDLHFSGRHVQENGMVLGDVDNDGELELIVGSVEGEVLVWKGRECIQRIDGLGMVVALGVGNVLNCGSNVLTVVSGDGWCRIFLCLLTDSMSESKQNTPSNKLQLVHAQRIPANAKTLLIGDVDGDGSVELVIGLTDRVVRAYRWAQNFTGGKLLCLNKWECAKPIGNMTDNVAAIQSGPDTSTNIAELLISQPAATFMRIRCHSQHQHLDKMVVDYQPLTLPPKRKTKYRSAASTRVLGNIKMSIQDSSDTDKATKNSSPYALAICDGTVVLLHNHKILWHMQVDDHIFRLSKLDVTGDGEEELVSCSWNSTTTYFFDKASNAIRLNCNDNTEGLPVLAFCTGLYNLHTDKIQHPVPCLFYAMLPNKIRIYFNVRFEHLTKPCDVLDYAKMVEQKAQRQSDSNIFSKFLQEKNNSAVLDKRNKQFVRWALYGNHRIPSGN